MCKCSKELPQSLTEPKYGSGCGTYGTAGCKYGCVISEYRTGTCDENDTCKCSNVRSQPIIEDEFGSKINEINETRLVTTKEVIGLVPAECMTSPGFCDRVCREIGHVNGTWNLEKTDCTCNENWVTVIQYILCLDGRDCALHCRRRGKETGVCQKNGGWECECDTIEK